MQQEGPPAQRGRVGVVLPRGTSTRCFWGDDMSKMGEYCWWHDNCGMTTHPVGQKKPNAYGLYDTMGLVWEWCSEGGGPDATDHPCRGHVRQQRADVPVVGTRHRRRRSERPLRIPRCDGPSLKPRGPGAFPCGEPAVVRHLRPAVTGDLPSAGDERPGALAPSGPGARPHASLHIFGPQPLRRRGGRRAGGLPVSSSPPTR